MTTTCSFRPEQAQRAFGLLEAAGFVRLPGKDEWVEKHLPPLWRNNGYQWDGYLFDPLYPRPVEIHTLLWESGWRGLAVTPLSGVWATAQQRPLTGGAGHSVAEMRLMSDEDTLIHLAVHFSGHLVEREARLNQLLDLARFAAARQSSLKWPVIKARAAACGVARFVYAGLWLAHQLYRAPLPPTEIMGGLARLTPVGFRRWLAAEGVVDVLTGDYRQRRRGMDYRLTFLAAVSITERLGVVRFALLPPVAQLRYKYRPRYRWQTPLLYPRYVAERVGHYLRDWVRPIT
jgi:hypothetical protein